MMESFEMEAICKLWGEAVGVKHNIQMFLLRTLFGYRSLVCNVRDKVYPQKVSSWGHLKLDQQHMVRPELEPEVPKAAAQIVRAYQKKCQADLHFFSSS